MKTTLYIPGKGNIECEVVSSPYSFPNSSGSYVLLNEGAEALYHRYSSAKGKIAQTMQFGAVPLAMTSYLALIAAIPTGGASLGVALATGLCSWIFGSTGDELEKEHKREVGEYDEIDSFMNRHRLIYRSSQGLVFENRGYYIRSSDGDAGLITGG